jgi:uncharacterized protein YbjT (DUF2867 family)
MNITVFGATGGIGGHALRQALTAGHQVTAVVRDPAKLTGPTPSRTITADLTTAEPAIFDAAVSDADAVLSCLGPRSRSDVGITASASNAIVRAMKATDTRRIVVVSAAPIGTTASPGRPNPPKHDPGDGLFMRTVLGPMIKTILRANYADLALMEDALRDSGLDWTVVRPPRLTDKPLTGTYRTARDENVRGGTTISRADVAHLMLATTTRPDTVGHTIGIAN